MREGEFANAQNATGVPERVVNQYNKVKSGERLNPEQRADFVAQAKNLYAAQRQAYEEQAKRYRALAEKSGLNPDDVTGDMQGGGAAPAATDGKVTVRGKVNGVEKTFRIDAAKVPQAEKDGFRVVP